MFFKKYLINIKRVSKLRIIISGPALKPGIFMKITWRIRLSLLLKKEVPCYFHKYPRAYGLVLISIFGTMLAKKNLRLRRLVVFLWPALVDPEPLFRSFADPAF